MRQMPPVERFERSPRRDRFGVELETSGISPDRAAEVIRALGMPCENEGYNHHVRGTWKVVRDGSVSGFGTEVVSPPLPMTPAGFDELRRVMNALRTAGATVNASCGMHVHIGVEGMTRHQVIAFVEAYLRRHDSIDRLVAASRRGRTQWCSRLTEVEWASSRARIEDGTFTSPATGRYRSVNLDAYRRYGTVEFRQHQGTMNARKAVAWVQMLIALRDYAISGGNGAVSTGLGFLGDLVDQGHLPQQTAAYLTARADALAS